MNQESAPSIQEEFGNRGERKNSIFHYNDESYEVYLTQVPSYIPKHHRINVARRISNNRSLLIRDVIEKSIKARLKHPKEIVDGLDYKSRHWNGSQWLLAVAPTPIGEKISVGESEFAITSGDQSVYQSRVGSCLGIIMIDQSKEILTTHIYPVAFDQPSNDENQKISAVCEMYLYQIELIYPGIDPQKIILNTYKFDDEYKRIFERLLQERYPNTNIFKYEKADIEYDPKSEIVYELTSNSLKFDTTNKRYFLDPVRVKALS